MHYKKSLRLMLPALALSTGAFAQSASSPFVFPQFVKGTVLQKGGGVVEAQLDYNTITQEMMFDKDGSKLVLDQTDNIDTAYLDGRKFIPAKTGFYEKLTNTPVALYVQYKSTAVNSNASIGAGGGSNNAVGGFVGVKQVKGSSKIDNYALQLPAGYSVKAQNTYFFQKGGQFYAATDAKKVAKVFPDKEVQLSAFVKDNNINFGKSEDMVKLTEFLNK